MVPTSIIRLPAVAARTGLGRSTILRDVALGAFPKPIRLGAGSVGWIEAEVQTWIEARIRESRPDLFPDPTA